VFFNSSGVKTPLGDPKYDPIYRAAEDNGLPVVYHGAAAPGLALDFPIIQHEMQTYMANHTLAHVYSQMLTLTSLFENGTPAKFPDIDFVFQEAGVAWLSLIFRLNRDYKQRRAKYRYWRRRLRSTSVTSSTSPLNPSTNRTTKG